MSYMLEIFYAVPADPGRERQLTASAEAHGGRLDYREVPEGRGPVCLTFEFPRIEQAWAAAETLRGCGEHVEGPADYGD